MLSVHNKYTNKGDICLKAIKQDYYPNIIKIACQDTGSGIPIEMLKNIN